MLTAVALCWLGEEAGRAATLSVTPAVIGNTYPGVITLDIGGVTNGEQVTIQKYIDANANGAVDPGEPLADSFKVADGGAFVIGGVTNINVPFDNNPATGAISVKLSIAPPRSLANLVGQYVFVLSSPVQNFSPVTAALTITNGAVGQAVKGVVYSNGVAPAAYAVVAVLQMVPGDQGGRWVTGVIADNAGHYQVSLEPGSYLLLPACPGYFTDMSLAAQVTLSNGTPVTRDLYLTNATTSISGRVYNAGNSNGVGGLPISLEGGGSCFAITFTDTNGNYSGGVAPGYWKVKVDSEDALTRAFVVSQNGVQVDATGGSVSNLDVGLWKATALLFGKFTNTAGLPMTNIALSANDSAWQYNANAITDAKGRFCAGILGGTNEWYCSPNSSDPALVGYIISQFSSTNVSVGQAFPLNLTALPATASISGHVVDSLGHPVAGLNMLGNTAIGGVDYAVSTLTDAGGNYVLSAAPGVWNVAPNCCGDNSLDSLGLTDTTSHWVTIPPTNAVLNLTLLPYGTPALTQPDRAGSTFAFLLTGAPGSRYTIQTCTNLASTNWVTVTVTNMQGNFLSFQDQSTSGRRFYRALLTP